MASALSVAVIGASGRMGRLLLRAVAQAPDLELAAAVVRPGSAAEGADAGELAGIGPLGLEAGTSLRAARLAIDFSLAEAGDQWIRACADQGTALVSGVTGITPDSRNALDRAAERIPVLWAANFSLGIQVLTRILSQAASLVGEDADYEILEAHHRYKQDAPSGTALELGRVLNRALGRDDEAGWLLGRGAHATARQAGEIGFSSLRAGDIPGEHTILLGLEGERLELTHRAGSREAFVRGALDAARWLAEQAPGSYHLGDLLEDRLRGQ